jgi:DNA-binding transcriptional LysR family regulator
MQLIKTQQLALFIAVCETGSLSAGAEQLGLAKANASRMLKQLEYELNCRLINRSPHHFSLTQQGEEFLSGARSIYRQLSSLQGQINNSQQKISGRLRICAPSALSLMLQSKVLQQFSQQHPELHLEFLTGAQKPKVLEENFDLILNINTPKDSSLIARRAMKVRLNYYASPDYLKKHGNPLSPEDLHQHDCLINLNQDREPLPWQYKIQEQMHSLNIKAKHSSDNGLVIKEMVKNNLGIALLPEFLCQQELVSKQVCQLFNGQYGYPVQLYAIYPSRELISRKTQVFLEFIANEFADEI